MKRRPNPKWGYKIGEQVFDLSLNIAKTYDQKTGKWSPRKPNFQQLGGSWVIIEFGLFSSDNPVFGRVTEDEEEDEDDESYHLQGVIDLSTLSYEKSLWGRIEGIGSLHVLEPPAVSDARLVIEEVESEKLHKALDQSVATYAHVIRKLKPRIAEPIVAELINYLHEEILSHEEATDEAQILGEKLAGGPSKKEKELKEFVERNDTVKNWAKGLEERENRIHGTSIKEILSETRRMRQGNVGFREFLLSSIEILGSMRDTKIDEVIRELAFELESI